ncbi:hypothetical protein J1N35_011859, partial [Gossypium stocksii]
EGSGLGELGEGYLRFKGWGSGSKGVSVQSRRSLNRTIRGHGGCFKVVGNSCIPLANVMNSMFELSSDHVGMGSDTDIVCTVGDIQKEPTNPPNGRETRVSGSKVDLIIAKLGFQFSHCMEAIGFSGGIWIGWKDSVKEHAGFVAGRTIIDNVLIAQEVLWNGVPTQKFKPVKGI